MLVFTGAPNAEDLAHAPSVPCATQISSCGCTIKKPGTYRVTAALDGTNLPIDCIAIDASNVLLDLHGNTIAINRDQVQTTYFVAAIHITREANRAVVVGRGSTIENFWYGIEVEGKNATLTGFTAQGNEIGLYVLHAHGTAASGFDVSNNGDGVDIKYAAQNRLDSFTANNNGIFGVFFSSGADTNEISGFAANSNLTAGVQAGCPTFAGASGPCFGKQRGNVILGGSANGNSDGIVVEGSSLTHVIGNTAASNTGTDMFDDRADCDHNLWFGNVFGTASAPCIH